MKNPSQFLKCPDCHRKTVTITLHPDGDVMIQCDWCEAVSIAHRLHESDVEFS